jgi:transcriptional regulator with XRE-family HTH domain
MAEQYSLARALRVARAKTGWSQKELAQRAGLHAVQLSKLERGHTTEATATTIRALCKALGISADVLLGLTGDEETELSVAAVA